MTESVAMSPFESYLLLIALVLMVWAGTVVAREVRARRARR